jgi:hypothetical protein
MLKVAQVGQSIFGCLGGCPQSRRRGHRHCAAVAAFHGVCQRLDDSGGVLHAPPVEVGEAKKALKLSNVGQWRVGSDYGDPGLHRQNPFCGDHMA